jgi:hypothetical protein
MGIKMIKSSGQNYNSGKKQEKEADAYLRTQGYMRPKGKEKNNIVKAYALNEYELKSRAFDVIDAAYADYLGDIQKLASIIKDGGLCLYEMKSASATRKTPITESWEGLGFTYSSNEDHNWQLLGDERYKFIFVDCLRNKHIVLTKNDWLPNARTTPTMSVWITNPLTDSRAQNK